MKKKQVYILLSALFVVLLAGAVVAYNFLSKTYTPEEAAGSSSGTPSRDFTVLSLEGEEVSLSQHLGRPVVVNFWATWCGPCKSELPAFQAAYEANGDQVAFMMVNLTDGQRDTAEAVTGYIEESGFTFPVYLDMEMDAAQTYRISSVPLTLFIDAQGNVIRAQIGAMSQETLNRYIEQLLNA